MTQKTAYYVAMAEETASTVTRNQESWTSFLTTAAKFYKYPYNEQLMIHRQRPDATACAEYAFWNNRWGHSIKRGSKGIALVDYEGNKVNLRYVFDVTDTEERVNSRPVKLWSMQDEYHESVQAALTKVYAVSAGNGLTTQLEEIARQLAAEYWKEHDIRNIVDGSLLEEYDEDNLEVHFKRAVTVSVSYTLMSRCGMEPEQYFEPEDFVPIFEFNTKAVSNAMGIAVSKISQDVLRQIEVTIKNYEREHHVERNVDYERDHLQTGRGRPSPEHRIDRRGENTTGQVRNDAEKISGGASSGTVQLLADRRDTAPPIIGSRQGSKPLTGRDDAQVGTSSRSDRGTESQGSDEVGRTYEQLQSTGRGDYLGGTDLQLSFLTSDGEAEAENVADTSSAFSFAQSNIEAVTLRENLAARGIVDGRLVDSEKLDNDPFIQQVMADAENAGQENTLNPDAQNLISPDDVEHTPDQELYQVGNTVYLEDTAYTITEVRESSVELLPPNQVYPIYRAESKENFARLLEQDTRNAKYLSRTEHAHESMQIQTEEPYTIAVTNFRITDEHLGEGGAKAKFQANFYAINLLKELEESDRQAIPEQQQVLSRYVGWGGLADAFDPDKPAWSKEYQELKEVLTPAEYDAARASTLNAHYTSPIVINAMYEAVGKLGFEQGRILEIKAPRLIRFNDSSADFAA